MLEETREQIASRYSKSNIPLNREKYSIGELLGEILSAAKAGCDEKGISLVTDITPSIPDGLYGDRARLSQILNYLL